jgi:hypothetical protein
MIHIRNQIFRAYKDNKESILINKDPIHDEERLPKTFWPKRYRKSMPKNFLIKEMITKFPNYYYRNLLINELKILPTPFIEICYEYGLEIAVLDIWETKLNEFIYKRKKYPLFLENIFGKYENCGTYLDSIKLLLLNKLNINLLSDFPSFNLMARAFSSAIFSNPLIKYVPKYNIRLDNRFKYNFIIKYTIEKGGIDYFSFAFEAFMNEKKKINLKKTDRPLFDIFSEIF